MVLNPEHDRCSVFPMRIQSYRDLIVWQKSVMLATTVYRVTARLPRAEKYGIVSQLRRAAVSIPANIAEGHGRATRGEFLNQLSVARGSLNEVETLLTICERLELARARDLVALRGLVTEVGRMLVRMREKLSV